MTNEGLVQNIKQRIFHANENPCHIIFSSFQKTNYKTVSKHPLSLTTDQQRNFLATIYSQHCCLSSGDKDLEQHLRLDFEQLAPKWIWIKRKATASPVASLRCDWKDENQANAGNGFVCEKVTQRLVVVLVSYHSRLEHLQLFLKTIGQILKQDANVFLVISSLKQDSEAVKNAVSVNTSINNVESRVFTVSMMKIF